MNKLVCSTATLLLVLSGLSFAGGAPEGELGTEDHPLRWAVQPSGDDPAAIGELATEIYELTGIHIQPMIAQTNAAILEAFEADPAAAHMSVLPALAYLAAFEQGLVEPALVGVRNSTASYEAKVVANRDAGLESLEDLAGRSFARPGPLSPSGWIVPSLMMRAAGLNPDDLSNLRDLDNHAAVIEAVYEQDVDAGALYVGGLAALAAEFDDLEDVIVVLAESASIPNEGVQFSPEVPEELRDQIVNALKQIIETPEGNELIRRLYSWDKLDSIDDSAYDPLRQLLDQAEISIQQIVH